MAPRYATRSCPPCAPRRPWAPVRSSAVTTTRRGFLAGAGLAAAGLAVACSAPAAPSATPAPQPTAPLTPLASGRLATAQDSLVRWRHGVIQVPFNATWTRRAATAGYWAQELVETDFQAQNTDILLLRSLIAGDIDSAEVAPQAVISAIEEGAPLRIVGTFSPGLPGGLPVRAGVGGLEQLSGRPVAITARGGLPDTLLKAVLADRYPGLYDRLELAIVPNQVAMVQAVVGGRVDAAGMVTFEYFNEIEKAGGRIALRYADALPSFIRQVIVTNDKVLAERQRELARWFLAGVRGVRDFLTDPDQAVAVAVAEAGLAPEVARATWQYYVDRRLLQPNGYLAPDQLAVFQALNLRLGNQRAILPPARLFDGAIQALVPAVIGAFPGYPAA